MSDLLQINNLTMRFSGLVAVNQLSFNLEAQKITSLIGPNGAGKTTVFNCITGFYRPSAGQIHLHHEKRPLALHQMNEIQISQQANVVRTFQNIRLFGAMSVLENLLVAQHNTLMRASGYTLGALLYPKYYKQKQKLAIERACYWLEKTQLIAFADQIAGRLPYGAQRKLEIARALCAQPRLLCLDEPAAGLNPVESQELGQLLRFIQHQHQTTILLIEHDMQVVMDISDFIVVLDYGEKIAEGVPQAIRHNPQVIAAYLGED
jgi:branched-chain amino acid transport system ATP-binding protein